ncbi:hypothetical protein ACR79S_19290 [Sphingobacterium spiritivorum]|uniref:hypothetical protein n=1 Tax=Sphingobacterium spiritivorum TaxID=258 RepID=UPI003DA2C0DF
MEVKDFLIGCGMLVGAASIYRFFLKNQGPSTTNENRDGPTLPNYYGLWFGVVALIMLGVYYIFISFQR